MLSMALQDAVTRLKAQERATSARADASEQLSSQIVNSLTAGLMVVDGTGRVETLNPAGRRLLEVTADPIGLNYQQLLARVAPLRDVIAECQAMGSTVVRRTLQMPPEMRASHFGVTVSPLVGATGPDRVICLFADLTTVHELEEQLRLKDTLARLGEITAGIAHEFRNGLATIHGYGRLIDPRTLPEQYRPYVEGIREETAALGRVVTNFLSFARPADVTFTRIEIGPLVQRAVADIMQELEVPNRIEVTGSFGAVDGDDVMLRQAFANLLRNAVQACVSVGLTPRVLVEGDAEAGQGQCRISVLDNGPGVEPAVRSKLFVPFFTARRGGTGLGLAIVQKIVVTHRGRVTVGTSHLGGAQFDVLLPQPSDDAVERRPA
jgi:signal transduction histidine kinase